MKLSLLFLIILFIFKSFVSRSQSDNAKGDFDFNVIVLDQSKNPLPNLEVKIKNEDEELMSKKTTGPDGTIEFRGLFKNKSYHVEFYNYDERIKDADKIFLKDQFKTEEITKAETGFDYFIFVGDNLSFSELGTRDLAKTLPKKKAAKQNNNQVASSQSTEQKDTSTEKTAEPNKEETVATTSIANKQESTTTTTEVINAEKTESNTLVTQKSENIALEENKEKTNEIKQPELVKSENVIEEKKQELVKSENVIEEKKQDPSIAEEKNEPSDVATKKTETQASQESSLANNLATVDFSSFKDKDFNNQETHELLIKEEKKISNKKIKYKIQVGAYTHQEVANQVKINGFGALDKQNYPDGFTRITVGNCKSLSEAETLRKKVIAKGNSGAWIVGFLDGKRYTMKELVANNFFQ